MRPCLTACRLLGGLVVALLATGAAACDPKPPNDGRDIGIIALSAPTDVAPGEEVTVRGAGHRARHRPL